MSISQGLPNYLSSVANIGTRLQGPAVSGQAQDVSGGPLVPAGGFMCVQSTASLTNQVVTTSANVIGNRASYVYIPVLAGSLQGSTAGPPYLGCGTPLLWDDTARRLNIWSSSAGAWLTASSSAAFSS